MDLTYEEVINHLETERSKLLDKLKNGNGNGDFIRGALVVLDKLIMQYEDKLEDL
ncbi:hypothetical protein BH753_gp072 [Bacillus phage Shbh1]|uniref:Uncharacterized protein n=1 Tax=Bacillus phage Shbh1 TaxID=1796992 RepID=A0A142F197_9CAUD|nr:hypothetical protein BH753_gp072 [Bacillus phage Shbh1]AMQ66554.1 hypothetical protein [Bacillus phage Shbh1]